MARIYFYSMANTFKVLSGKIEDFARDLSKLEVNTILKENIQAAKMLAPRHAIIDIGHDFMQHLSRDIGAPVSEMEWDPKFERYGIKKGEQFEAMKNGDLWGYGTISLIREQARRILVEMGNQTNQIPPGEARREFNKKANMVDRIKTNSDTIKGMLKTDVLNIPTENKPPKWRTFTRKQVTDPRKDVVPPLDLTSNELTQLRKIWEIRTEVIVMQSVVQLDGDVINRFNPDYAQDVEEHRVIFELHNKGVDTSLHYWSSLVDLVKNFFRSFVK